MRTPSSNAFLISMTPRHAGQYRALKPIHLDNLAESLRGRPAVGVIDVLHAHLGNTYLMISATPDSV